VEIKKEELEKLLEEKEGFLKEVEIEYHQTRGEIRLLKRLLKE